MEKKAAKVNQKPKVLQLAVALRAALDAANAIPVEDMGGSCNLDSPIVKLPRWRREDVQSAAEIAGVYTSKWRRGFAFGGYDSFQADNRMVKAEAFVRVMCEHGYDAYVHYAMD